MCPAVLGSSPAFPERLPFARPLLPPLEEVTARLAPSYERGILTNGPLTRALEARAAEYLGVRHALAIANCTSGLMLALQSLQPKESVVVPSFTFSASAHAIAWNGRVPRFVECEPDSCQVDVTDVERALASGGVGGILATHVFGAPCDQDQLALLAQQHGVPLVFDAAHAFGATHGGAPVGSIGDAQVFSLSPTKLVVAGEGGIVTTDRDDVAYAVEIGRDYGNAGDYDTRFAGLNARMSELHAAMALASLDRVDEHLARRRALAARYRDGLRAVPGIDVQRIDDGDESTFKDFTILVDDAAFGLDRDALARALDADGIDTRPYFSPPVHHHQAYAELPPVELPVTDRTAARVLSLPMFGALSFDEVDRVVAVVAAVHEHADEISTRA